MQAKPTECRQKHLLACLPTFHVTAKQFGELLLGQLQCKGKSLRYSDNTRLSQALPPSRQHPRLLRAAKHGCKVTPPAVRQPLHTRQHVPAAINPPSAAPRAQLLDLGSSSLAERAIQGY